MFDRPSGFPKRSGGSVGSGPVIRSLVYNFWDARRQTGLSSELDVACVISGDPSLQVGTLFWLLSHKV